MSESSICWRTSVVRRKHDLFRVLRVMFVLRVHRVKYALLQSVPDVFLGAGQPQPDSDRRVYALSMYWLLGLQNCVRGDRQGRLPAIPKAIVQCLIIGDQGAEPDLFSPQKKKESSTFIGHTCLYQWRDYLVLQPLLYIQKEAVYLSLLAFRAVSMYIIFQ